MLLLVGWMVVMSVSAEQNATLLWRTKVGCTHWGPGCWVPGFSGTDSSPASVNNDSITIGAYGDLMIGSLFRIALDDGSIQWTVKQSGGEGSPAVSSAGVVFTSTYNSFKAISASGRLLWEWHTPDRGQIGSSGALDEQRELIFIGTLRNTFYAVNSTTGYSLATQPGP